MAAWAGGAGCQLRDGWAAGARAAASKHLQSAVKRLEELTKMQNAPPAAQTPAGGRH